MAKTVTAIGTAQVDTAQKVFGTGSCLLDGNSDYLSVADSDDFAFGTGDFCINLRLRFAGLQNSAFYNQQVDASNKINIFFWNTAGGRIGCNIYSGGSTVLDFYCPFTAGINTWYDIEISRVSGVIYVFIDGVAQTLTLNGGSYSASLPNFAAPLLLGSEGGSGVYVNGWIEEYRIKKGQGGHTSNFTPETSAFTADSYTVLLLHMDGTDGSTSFPDSSGSFHTATLTETTTITDTIIKTTSRILSQVLSLTDSITKVTNYVLTQTVILTDSFVRQVTRIFNEIITHTDIVEGIKVLYNELTEIITIVDISLNRLIQKVYTETIALTDTIIKISNRIFEEIVNITDTLEKAMLYCKTLIENLSISDFIVRITERLFTEVSTITDTIVSSKLYTRIYTEITTITDVFTKQLNINRVFSETVSIVSEIIISLNGVVTNMWTKVARTLDSWNKTPRN